MALGVHTDALYELRDQGQIVWLGRGLYRLADADEFENPDLGLVAVRAPQAAVCLISALSYHNITTQIPAAIHLAVPRGAYSRIKIDRNPMRVYQYDAATFEAGLETRYIDGRPVKIYSAARTVVDAFKFRNKIGLDVAIEALQYARQRLRIRNMDLEPFAELLRVSNVMSPYLLATYEY